MIFSNSCTVSKKNNAIKNIKQETSESTKQPSFNDEKDSAIDLIFLKDIYNGQVYSLNKISSNLPVFIEVTASWCSACKEMYITTSKLYDLFKEKVFFVRVFLPQDPEKTLKSPIPAMLISASPAEINIENSQILPRVIIVNKSGDIAADLSGQYPLLYYYSILSEL